VLAKTSNPTHQEKRIVSILTVCRLKKLSVTYEYGSKASDSLTRIRLNMHYFALLVGRILDDTD
jgi:hypothetical protein